MIAISTVGCHRHVEDYVNDLHEQNIFKNFEYMAHQKIVSKKNMLVVDICLQPTLTKPQDYNLSSINENKRLDALSEAHKMVSYASANRCSHVILWPGQISGYKYEEHEKLFSSSEEINLPSRKDVEPYLEKLCRSLFTLCKQFPDTSFCVPTPRTFYELPGSPQQLQWIIEDVKCPNLFYWHNTCSAQHLEKQNLSSQESWLGDFANFIAGVHLEDTHDKEFLMPPGTGEVNFKMVKNYLPKNCIRVFRISEQFGLDGIRIAFDTIRSL